MYTGTRHTSVTPTLQYTTEMRKPDYGSRMAVGPNGLGRVPIRASSEDRSNFVLFCVISNILRYNTTAITLTYGMGARYG